MPYSQHTVRSRLKTRQLDKSVARAVSIGWRYGSDSRNFTSALGGFVDLTSAFHVKPTFPVPAMVLHRHPQVLMGMAGRGSGAELAAHGYAHLDYTGVRDSEVEQHLLSAKSIFRMHGFDRIGFRFPFLRRNPGLLAELDKHSLTWDSSEVLNWDILERGDCTGSAWDAYKRILETYAPLPASGARSLPYFIGNLVEIPVSMPDDDVLIDRMNIRDSGRLSSVWDVMLMEAWRREEALVLQLHPERYPIFRGALLRLLRHARGLGNVWTASLGEIAEWWKERSLLRFEFRNLSRHETEISCHGSSRAGLYFRSPMPVEMRAITTGSRAPLRWRVAGRVRPWVGISLDVPDSGETVHELKRQGVIYQRSASDIGFACYISSEAGSVGATKRILGQFTEKTLRLGAWPGGNRCAFSVTGDIDGLDIWDFWSRFNAR
jgi:peptidoglycan/xylan/chitin deacetylase (PgdA/CDA1 family)